MRPRTNTTPGRPGMIHPDNQQTLDKFLYIQRKSHGLAAMTCDAYRLKLEPFFRYQDSKPLADWTYGDFEDYIATRGWGQNTKRKFFIAARKFLKWCQSRSIPCGDFIGNMEPPARGQRKEPTVATREEVVKLLDASYGHRLHVCVALAALAGLRRAEIAILEWRDVNLEARLLTVRSPKTHRTETVQMNGKLVEILADWKTPEDQPGDQVIRFPCFAGKNNLGNRDLARLCDQTSGVNRRLGWHAFRHFFCSSMLNGGVPVDTVQKCMRHKSLAVTNLYAHPHADGVAAAVEVVL